MAGFYVGLNENLCSDDELDANGMLEIWVNDYMETLTEKIDADDAKRIIEHLRNVFSLEI